MQIAIIKASVLENDIELIRDLFEFDLDEMNRFFNNRTVMQYLPDLDE